MIRLLIFLIIFVGVTICTHAQQEQRNFGIAEVFRSGDSIFIKKLVTQVVNISEGTVTKMRTPPDTAKLFIAPDGLVYEGVITWKKVGGTLPPPVFVTEKVDGERATFSTNWSLHGPTTAAGWFGPTIAYSNVVGSSVSYTFTGTRIELFAEKLPTHGRGVVNLNGVDTQVSFIGPKELPALIYTSPVLPLGTYTIKLTVVSGYCLIDYFQIVKPQ
jgi:hypothetical protein